MLLQSEWFPLKQSKKEKKNALIIHEIKIWFYTIVIQDCFDRDKPSDEFGKLNKKMTIKNRNKWKLKKNINTLVNLVFNSKKTSRVLRWACGPGQLIVITSLFQSPPSFSSSASSSMFSDQCRCGVPLQWFVCAQTKPLEIRIFIDSLNSKEPL